MVLGCVVACWGGESACGRLSLFLVDASTREG